MTNILALIPAKNFKPLAGGLSCVELASMCAFSAGIRDVVLLIIPPDESCELDTLEEWAEVERRWKERT